MPTLRSVFRIVGCAVVAACSVSNANLPRWVEHLQPSSDELSFQAIDWIPQFAEGVRESDGRQLPMFFWAMNGHPLGCT